MERLTIRPATLADIPSLAQLMGQLGYPTETIQMETRLKTIMAHDDYHTLVAEINNGHYYEKDGGFGQIVTLVVKEGFRGHHVGSSLMAAGENWLKEKGTQRALLTSGNFRKDAHQFYKHLGYDANGIRFVKTFE
jgi:GNAT superfamily N-acetyltransferase